MEQPEMLRRAIDALDSSGIPYMLVGSLASMVYGEPRLTNDIDLVVDLQLNQVDVLCSAFPSPEFYVSREAASQAVRRRHQFNVLHPASGNKIDFMMSRNDSWGRLQMTRRQKQLLFPDLEGFAAAPEDVIIAKLIYFQQGESEKHIRDITGILRLCPVEVDTAYIEHWTAEMGLSTIWNRVLERLKK